MSTPCANDLGESLFATLTVAIFPARSVDGLHQQDLDFYVNNNPYGTLAALSAAGTTYSNASTSAPSDSFPGVLALHTGAQVFPYTPGPCYSPHSQQCVGRLGAVAVASHLGICIFGSCCRQVQAEPSCTTGTMCFSMEWQWS